MEETFEEYLKQARWKFTTVAEKYLVENHLELRTAIDSLLIAYDQAVHQALSLGVVVERSEQLPCEMCGGKIDKEDKFTDEKHCENCGWF